MLAETQLLDQMQSHCNDANGHPFCVYGEAAYSLHTHLHNYFKFMNFKKNLKTGLSPSEKNVRSLCLFAKCTHNSAWEHNCKLFPERTSKLKSVFFVI